MRLPRGIGIRIALAAVVVSAVALAIVAFGVWVIGGQTFASLMFEHGEDAAEAQKMFDDAVTKVLLIAVAAAALSGIALSAVIGTRLGRPLRDMSAAAQRVARGDYSARVPRHGTEEMVSVADSFNQMATSLERQEQARREFMANAAHELRTPLTNLQGYLEALRDEVIQPDRQTFESLWEEADRLVRLSRSLDQLANGDAVLGPPEYIDLDLPAAIRGAVDLIRPAAHAAGVEVRSDGPEALPATADPDRLAQIMANLLQNAVRYTPRGGSVVVRWEKRPSDILVSVANSGAGIPAADLPYVFERFYRVEKSRDRARGGAGIGLAIVRQLVESAGGAVGAESADGTTRFWFTLPPRPLQAAGA